MSEVSFQNFQVCRRPNVPSPAKPGVCGAMYRMRPVLLPPPRPRHPTLTALPANLSKECQPRGTGTCGASGKWRQASVPGAFLATFIPHCRSCLKRRNFSTMKSYGPTL